MERFFPRGERSLIWSLGIRFCAERRGSTGMMVADLTLDATTLGV
jgi:hypothetical protein